MILRCQQIHQQILKKSASSIMGADSEGDKGLELSEDSESGGEEEDYEDNADGGLVDGVTVAGAALLVAEQAVVEELAGGIGSKTQSRGPTPTSQADDNDDGGIGIMAPDELPIALVPPLQYTTQQSAKGAVPLYVTKQSTEGATNAPLDLPRYGQAFLTPDMTPRPYQQLYQHRDFTASGHGAFAPLQQHAAVPPGTVPAQQQPQTGVVATQQQPAGQQPVVNPPQPSTQQSVKKKVKKGSESLSNKKMKNSLSERRGLIVKSIDKLASSIVTTDEANSAAAASSSSMMPMFLVM
jgi:hypothetical protein